MADAMKFWFAKGLVEFLTTIGLFAAIFMVAIVVVLVKTYRQKSKRRGGSSDAEQG